jgi:signal transduction histidine kinase
MLDNTKGLLEIFQALFFDSEFRNRYFDALDLSTIVQFVYEGLEQIGPWTSVAILLPGEEGIEITDYCGFDRQPGVLLDRAMTMPLLAHANEPLDHVSLVAALASTPDLQKQLEAWSLDGVRTWLPLAHQGKLEAVLALAHDGDRVPGRNREQLLRELASQASVVFARARMADELRGQIHEVQALSRQLLALQDKNQQRLAIELHDQTVQDLIFVIRLLQQAQRRISSPLPEVAGAIDEILRIIAELRATIFELRPPELGHDDLAQLLNEYIMSLRQRRDISVQFQCIGSCDCVSVNKTIQEVCFRILQEALNNVWKHTPASSVEVILNLQPNRLRLEIRDDGLGFEVPDRMGTFVDRGHLGLIGMRERATSVGGQFSVQSKPGAGTCILLEISISTD